MNPDRHYTPLAILIASALLLVGTILLLPNPQTPSVQAQDAAPMSSPSNPVEVFYADASHVCIGQPLGYFCNGGGAPTAEPVGPISGSLSVLGALVEVGVVDALQTTPFLGDCTSAGLFWMRVAETSTSAILVGDVSIRDASLPGFPAWQSIQLQTGEAEPPCSVAPRSSLIVQNAQRGQPVQIVINGASLELLGTAVVQTHGSETVFITLEGQARVVTLGQPQPMIAGQMVRVPYNPGDFSRPNNAPGLATPYEQLMMRNFPIPLLDRAIIVPQPGYVASQGQVNLRSAPSTDAGVMSEVPGGQVMTILGRNAGGDWYHVRLQTGQSGWILSELLQHQHGEIAAIYDATPLPPQRYGTVGTTARVLAPEGVTLRDAPDITFTAIGSLATGAEVLLMARSPYSPWVKIEGGGMVGWVALIALETQAIIESLPVDYDVPPPPEPTRVPGSWGNAFPDPRCYPNCGP
ncbi:MAG: SH3 domain-containing protein [bacterium]|nr:SH3 domain-containing protein [bacterium]